MRFDPGEFNYWVGTQNINVYSGQLQTYWFADDGAWNQYLGFTPDPMS